ncbi:Na+/glutamate symporter [Pseudoclavibacter chungangensis]|uniref:hypothetical protein n=1 Tax=Pseudoclavibacter chungangensis TaxID=587635 RepID=UPI0015C6D962|nr:hypothetical protein [Pseudoclavibacter chungangensis]NYJ66329.1 Na+/glutamate symporter [Pseudoclavibacter chungangensis]
MEYTPQALLVDAGLIGMLLIVGTLARATIKPLQTMMIPASVIAGALGLLLGPNGLGLLPFSDQLGTYGSLLIVIVFACLALTDDFNILKIGRNVAGFAAYGVLMYSLQVVVGLVLVLLLLGPLLGAPDSIGLMLFAGWAGGFGSAAAIGTVFAEAGQPEVQSIAFTAATVGMLVGVVGGIIQAKIGAMRGQAKEFAGMTSMPEDLRTGVLDQIKARPSSGRTRSRAARSSRSRSRRRSSRPSQPAPTASTSCSAGSCRGSRSRCSRSHSSWVSCCAASWRRRGRASSSIPIRCVRSRAPRQTCSSCAA